MRVSMRRSPWGPRVCVAFVTRVCFCVHGLEQVLGEALSGRGRTAWEGGDNHAGHRSGLDAAVRAASHIRPTHRDACRPLSYRTSEHSEAPGSTPALGGSPGCGYHRPILWMRTLRVWVAQCFVRGRRAGKVQGRNCLGPWGHAGISLVLLDVSTEGVTEWSSSPWGPGQAGPGHRGGKGTSPPGKWSLSRFQSPQLPGIIFKTPSKPDTRLRQHPEPRSPWQCHSTGAVCGRYFSHKKTIVN